MNPTSQYLLEVAWEVCNKVGGIHTVITSKLEHARRQFSGDHYLAVGPWITQSEHPEFKEAALPTFLQEVATDIANLGVSIHYGNWQVPGEPAVVLLDWSGIISKSSDYKYTFWQQFGLDTLGSDFYDIDQPLLWSLAAGIFARSFATSHPEPVFVHGHEWLTAGLFLELGRNKPENIKTVFTTHATVLGRALMAKQNDLYGMLATIHPEQEAQNAGVLTKHQLEKLSAQLADIFTTVSTITDTEAEAILGRKADVVTENGIDPKAFPLFDQIAISHAAVRERLLDFTAAYFFPSYRFDLTKTSFHFTMGRYETHNKGYDLYLAGLAELNQKLKAEKSEKTLLSFFLVPGDALHIRPETATKLLVYARVATAIRRFVAGNNQTAYGQLLSGRTTELRERFGSNERQNSIDHVLSRLPQNDNPSFSPIALRAGDQDDLVRTAHFYGLTNAESDPVKVIFLPVYLDGFDGIFNIHLYELITGFDYGVFPSLYEPWGYTPLESLALGIPSLTTNLAGFGRALARIDTQNNGCTVMSRTDGTFADQAHVVAEHINTSLNWTRHEQIEARIDAYRTAGHFSWDRLYVNYENIYQLAESD